MLLRARLIFFGLFCFAALTAQSTYNDLAKDTIICRSTFLNRTYLLDGNKLTLPVMAFFMNDFPAARQEIRVALLTDQLSIAGYSLGSLFTVGGLLVGRQDRKLGGGLLQLGALGIGTGVVFQIISGNFKRKAVDYYNADIKAMYKKKSAKLQIGTMEGRAVIKLYFD